MSVRIVGLLQCRCAYLYLISWWKNILLEIDVSIFHFLNVCWKGIERTSFWKKFNRSIFFKSYNFFQFVFFPRYFLCQSKNCLDAPSRIPPPEFESSNVHQWLLTVHISIVKLLRQIFLIILKSAGHVNLCELRKFFSIREIPTLNFCSIGKKIYFNEKLWIEAFLIEWSKFVYAIKTSY